MRTFLCTLAMAVVAFAQTSRQPLQVTRIYAITSSWSGECGAKVVDNRSSTVRQNNYHSLYAAGSGNWTVTMEYSNTSCSGPWAAMGSASSITQVSNPPIAYGTGYYPYIRITVTGGAVVTYTATRDFFLSNSTGSIAFPITMSQGGTGIDLSPITKGGLIVGTASGVVGILGVGPDGYYATADSTQAGGIKWSPFPTTGSVTSVTVSGPLSATTNPIVATGTISCPTCITSAASAALNQIVLGSGSQGVQALGSLGTTAQVLHGNASGAPTWGQVVLTTDVTGVLPVGNGGTQWTPISGGISYAGKVASSATGFQYPGGSVRSTAPAFIAEVMDYQFSPITPTGSPSLIIGSNTVTIPTAPLGMSGSNTHYYVYISGGTGTAEAALVTGGSCTPGATSCTLQFTCANAHSGAYTLSPANGGWRECIISNTNGSCHGAAGTYYVYSPVYVDSAMKLFGDGPMSTYLSLRGTTIGGFDDASGHTVYTDLGITSPSLQTSGGYGIRLGAAAEVAFVKMDRLFSENVYDVILGVNANQPILTNSTFYNFAHAGVVAQDSSCPDCAGIQMVNNTFFNYTLSTPARAAVLIHSSSTIMIANNVIIGSTGGNLSYCIEWDSTTSGGWLQITGTKCESSILGGFYLHGILPAVSITGNTLGNSLMANNWNGIYAAGDGGGRGVVDVNITGNTIHCDGTGNNGIYLQSVYSNVSVIGNSLSGCNFGINANGAPVAQTVYIGQNSISSYLTNPIYSASGVIVDTSSPFAYSQMIDNAVGVGLAANGSRVYCMNCNSSCTAGGGTGRMCFKENGAWTR